MLKIQLSAVPSRIRRNSFSLTIKH